MATLQAAAKAAFGLLSSAAPSCLLPLCLAALVATAAGAGHYLWRLLRHGFPVRCWFCSGATRVPFGNRNCFDCPHCDQYNGFDGDGGYNKDVPAMRHSAMNLHRSQSSPQPLGGSSRPGAAPSALCSACNRNQALKVAELAKFEASSPSAEDAELAALRARLERAYALCQRCRAARRVTLQAQDIQLLPGLLAWQRQRVAQQQQQQRQHRKLPPTITGTAAAAAPRWLRVGAVLLACLGAAAAASAEAARVVCAPAVACMLAGLWLRFRCCCEGGSGGIRLVRVCDLWHGPAFFAAAEPLRSRLGAWLAEIASIVWRQAQASSSSAEPGTAAGLQIPPGLQPLLLPAALALPHALALLLNWRLARRIAASRSPRPVANGNGLRSPNTSNGSVGSNHSSDSISNNNSNNHNKTACINDPDDEDQIESASVFDHRRPYQAQPAEASARQGHLRTRQLHHHHQQQQQQQQQQPFELSSVFQRRRFTNSSASVSGGGGCSRPASLPPSLPAWPPVALRQLSQRSAFQPQRNRLFQSQAQPPPPPPPSTPTPFGLRAHGHHGSSLQLEGEAAPDGVRRSRSRSPSALRGPLPPLAAPSPMDVDDDAGGGYGDVGGCGDSAYASQRGSVADMPAGTATALGADGVNGKAGVSDAPRRRSRGRLAQVLIGCCLGVNFSLLLHCLLLPAARSLMAPSGQSLMTLLSLDSVLRACGLHLG